MATVAKFVQLIPMFLAYLVPLDVDVVPIKFHQFLFEIIKPKKSESVGQTLPQLPWKHKRGRFNFFFIPFIKLHETL
jgi:hypothetical protein